MAENGDGKKSTGIGELFVELGVKGLPTMLKSLNSVSASFLLGKNAASQFANMLTKPIKELGNTAVAVGKLSAALGTSEKNVQKLGNYFQKYGGSKEYINDLAKTQQMLYDTFVKGERGLDTGYIKALQRAKLDPTAYKGNFTDAIRLVNDIYKATEKMSDLEANATFRDLGWSEDMRYMFKRGGFNLNDALALPDDTIEKGQQAAENLQDFGIAMKALTDLLVVEFLPPLTDFVQWFTGVTKDILSGKKPKDIVENVDKKVTDNAGKIGVATAATGHPLVGATIIGAGNLSKMQRSAGGETGKYVPVVFGAGQMDFGTAPWIKKKLDGKATGGAAPIVPILTPTPQDLVPSNISSIAQTNNINITNQNNINGTNAQAIADSIISINENDISYSQYQISNPGQL